MAARIRSGALSGPRHGGLWVPDGAPVPDTNGWTEGQPPVLTAVSGTFADGETLTIVGGNFSAHRDGHLAFADFSTEIIGQPVLSLTHENIPGRAQYLGANESPLFGSKFARVSASGVEIDAAIIDLPSHYREIFFEGWSRTVRVGDFSGDAQIKYWRLSGGHAFSSAQVPGSEPTLGSTHAATGFTSYYSPGAYASYSSTPPVDNEWTRFSMYVKVGDPGIANGHRLIKTSKSGSFRYSGSDFKSPSGVHSADSWDCDNLVTDDGQSLVHPGIGRLFVPYYHRSRQTTQIDIAHVSINDSRERVVVGDAPTWSACTPSKTFILPHIARDSDTIQVRAVTGPLGVVGPAFLYVINKDGMCNASGYQVRAA